MSEQKPKIKACPKCGGECKQSGEWLNDGLGDGEPEFFVYCTVASCPYCTASVSPVGHNAFGVDDLPSHGPHIDLHNSLPRAEDFAAGLPRYDDPPDNGTQILDLSHPAKPRVVNFSVIQGGLKYAGWHVVDSQWSVDKPTVWAEINLPQPEDEV